MQQLCGFHQNWKSFCQIKFFDYTCALQFTEAQMEYKGKQSVTRKFYFPGFIHHHISKDIH